MDDESSLLILFLLSSDNTEQQQNQQHSIVEENSNGILSEIINHAACSTMIINPCSYSGNINHAYFWNHLDRAKQLFKLQ